MDRGLDAIGSKSAIYATCAVLLVVFGDKLLLDWLPHPSLRHAVIAIAAASLGALSASAARQRRIAAAAAVRMAVQPFAAAGDYVLYLRPFHSDGSTLIDNPFRINAPFISTNYSEDRQVLLESVLSRTYGDLRAIGGELTPAGPITISSDDADWHAKFNEMSSNARRIFVVPLIGPGTEWEMQQLRASRHLSKTLLVMPPHGAEGELRWNSAVERYKALGFHLPPYDSAGCVFALNPDGTLARSNRAKGFDPSWIVATERELTARAQISDSFEQEANAMLDGQNESIGFPAPVPFLSIILGAVLAAAVLLPGAAESFEEFNISVLACSIAVASSFFWAAREAGASLRLSHLITITIFTGSGFALGIVIAQPSGGPGFSFEIHSVIASALIATSLAISAYKVVPAFDFSDAAKTVVSFAAPIGVFTFLCDTGASMTAAPSGWSIEVYQRSDLERITSLLCRDTILGFPAAWFVGGAIGAGLWLVLVRNRSRE